MTAQTTAAEPAPIEAFRETREEFLNDLQGAVSGLLLGGFSRLEQAVIDREYAHSRELDQANRATAEARSEIENLNRLLGEHLEAAEDRVPSEGEPAATTPADPELAGKLAEAVRDAESSRETARGVGLENIRLQGELDDALAEIARLRQSADQPVDTGMLDGLRADVSTLQTRLTEAGLRAKLDRADALNEGRTGALRALEAIAADSPDIPVSEAVQMAAIALAAPAEQRADDEVTEGPAPEFIVVQEVVDHGAESEGVVPEFPAFGDDGATETAPADPPFIAVWEAPAEPAEDAGAADTAEFVLGEPGGEEGQSFVFAEAGPAEGGQGEGEAFFALPPDDGTGTFVFGEPETEKHQAA